MMSSPHWPAASRGVALLFICGMGVQAEPVTGRGSPASLRREAGHRESKLDAIGLDENRRKTLGALAGHLRAEDWEALPAGRRRQLLDYARSRFDGRDPCAVCWAPGTSAAILNAFHAVEEAAPVRSKNQREVPGAATQLGARWGQTATNGSQQNVQGQPITLTWSIVPDGTAIPVGFTGDTNDPSDFRSWIVGLYGGNASLPPDDPANQAWFSIFAGMFANYAAKTGLRYVYEPNDDGVSLSSGNRGILGVRGDIRISAHRIDGDPAPGESTTLAYNYFPDFGDMVIDSADSNFNNKSQSSRLLRNTIEHEHGHGIGLEHVCPINQTKLMEPSLSLSYLGLQFDDIYSAQRHYGDPLEVHGSLRDNDSTSQAAPIGLAGGAPFTFQWLSIDDNSDADYLSFAASAGSLVTLRVIPSSASYPEGAQNADGSCPAGVTFNSAVQQNLTLSLLGPDQSVLATANATGAGGTEEILSAVTSQSGLHYVRVTGDSTNAAQLYRLESSLVVPAVAFLVQSRAIQLESLLPPNGVIDPGETVAYQVEISNVGSQQAGNVQGTLSGFSGFTGFTVGHDYGAVPAGGASTGDYVFALSGSFGESVSLDLTLTADGGVSQVAPLTFTLGKRRFVLNEQFDGNGSSLPAGWSSSITSAGSGWAVATNDSFSPSSSVFAADVGVRGVSNLTSSMIDSTGSSLQLSFWHRYNTESGFDGGVLEVSVDGGAWTDLLAAGGSFLEGGYVGTLNQRALDPLDNRQAWTGNSGGWIRTRVALPNTMLNSQLQFRWRLGSDRNGAGEGWFLDDVVLDTGLFEPVGLPGADLVVSDGIASEGDAADTAEVLLTTPLPLIDSLPVLLQIGGDAPLGSEVIAADLPIPSIPPGQVEVPIMIEAVKDDQVEGPRTLTLEIDPAAAVVPGGNGAAVVTIEDTSYGQWAYTNLGLVPRNGPFDDLDDDLADNLTEYAWGTDGTSPSSFPLLGARPEGGLLRIDGPLAPLPPDVIVTPELSYDLQSWSPDGIETVPGGFTAPLTGINIFMRLRIDLAP